MHVVVLRGLVCLLRWYGESEERLAAIFDAANEMGGAIIFIDEVRVEGVRVRTEGWR